MYRPVDLLRVAAWGDTVGYLAFEGRDVAFQFDPAWIRSGRQIAPLHMPLARQRYVFRGLNRATFHGLPPAIADALPDRFGNALIDAYLAREGIPSNRITPLDRLAYLGHRGMGALTFEPEMARDAPPPSAIDLRLLTEEARRAVHGSIAGEDVDSLSDLIAVGTSAGGARAKAVIALDPASGEIRAGNMPVQDRFEQWLVKFDGVAAVDKGQQTTAPFCRIEYAYSQMAAAAGVEMSECRLLVDGDLAHFMTRRFDRPPDGRLHMVSLCGLAHLDFNEVGVHDVAQLFTVVAELGLGQRATNQVFRRAVFNVLAANNDDHTKNVAFLMDPAGAWRLAPAYDLTFASQPGNRWLEQHLMGVGGRFRDITRDDLLRLADRFGVTDARRTIREVAAAVAQWPDFAAEAGVPQAETDAIEGAHRAVAVI